MEILGGEETNGEVVIIYYHQLVCRQTHCKSGGSKIETYFTKIVFYTVDYDICICFLII